MKRFSLTGIGLPPGSEGTLARLDVEPFVAYFEARAPVTLPTPEPWPSPEAGRFERRAPEPAGRGAGADHREHAPRRPRRRRQAGDRGLRHGTRPGAPGRPRAPAGRAARDREGPEPRPRRHGRPRQGRPAGPARRRHRLLPARGPREGHGRLAEADRPGHLREARPRREGPARRWTSRRPTSTATATSTSWSPPTASTPAAASCSSRTARPTGSSRSSSPTTLDARSGAIHVPIADLDGDGRPDFVAALRPAARDGGGVPEPRRGPVRDEDRLRGADPGLGIDRDRSSWTSTGTATSTC